MMDAQVELLRRDPSSSVELIKRGEQMIVATLSRTSGGILISCKVHPTVEQLFRSWGGDAFSPVSKWGRQWEGRGGADLQAYGLNSNPGPTAIDGGGWYCLDRVGSPLFESRAIGPTGQIQEVINLSFLRLVGISTGPGAEFIVRGVFTPAMIKKIAESIKLASRSLYISYMKPVDITVMVLTQPWTKNAEGI